jgi:aquaporin Z
MNKALAESIGTFALVFFGCGTAVIGGIGAGATAVDLLGIASAFGFAIVAMAYGIGPNVNPAVSFGVFVAGRMSAVEMIQYLDRAGARRARRRTRFSGKASGWTGGLGQNGWGIGNFGEYNLLSAFVFEIVATFLFLVTILGVTHPCTPKGFAGLAIGLTLAAIHLVGINITGASVNPARSIGPALVGFASNPGAIAQLWLLIVAPLIGAGAAGIFFRESALLDAKVE